MKTKWSFNKGIEKKRDGSDGSNGKSARCNGRFNDRVEQRHKRPDDHDLHSDQRLAGGTQYFPRNLSDARIRLELCGQICPPQNLNLLRGAQPILPMTPDKPDRGGYDNDSDDGVEFVEVLAQLSPILA